MRKIIGVLLIFMGVFALISCKQDPAAPTEYKITFNANGGSGTMASMVVKVGDPVTLARGQFTKGEEQFTGWNTKPDYTGDIYTDEDTFTPGSDLTLYAQWVPANTFKITDGVLQKGTGFNTDKLRNNLAVPKYIGEATVTSLAVELFRGCQLIRKVSIPDSVVSLGQSAFESCITMTSVKLPSSLVNMADYVFRSCYVLEGITLPDSLTSIGEYAFRSCNLLKTVIVPDSVTSLGEGAFESCKSLESATLPELITEVPGWLFSSCVSLKNVVFKGSITELGSGVFYCSSGAETFSVPATVTTIGGNAFYGVDTLNSIYVNATVPPALGNNTAFNGTNNAPIYVPAASVDAYKTAENWSTYADRIQAAP